MSVKFTDTQLAILKILKGSDCGLTHTQFVRKCLDNDINTPFSGVKVLIDNGFARYDENPLPGRYKATPKAFGM